MEKSSRLKFVNATIEKITRKKLNPTNSTISTRNSVWAIIIPRMLNICTFSNVDVINALIRCIIFCGFME
jgi:hypothetical protein|tara:strand:- start:258 stop:467 length:210 start_codon:yes stop_codon:yes gene_type:complete